MSLKNVRYGNTMVEEVGSMLPKSFAVVTMPDPWTVVSPRLGRDPDHLIEVRSMDEEVVAEAEHSAPVVEAVLGVGGGAVMDMAKYVSWKRNIPLYQLPTIASVDAAVTTSIAVRLEGKVCYIGEAIPKVVAVDFPVVRGAPIRLNRAGVGDILSIHTALWDWKLSADLGKEPYSEDAAKIVAEMLPRMEHHITDLRDVTDEGVRLLFDLYNEETDVLENWGNSRPEEGSEHFFAYNMEFITGQEFVHGELVCLGVYVLSYIQGNKPDWVFNFINSVDVRYRLSELSITEEVFRETLLTLRDYVEKEELFYTVINEVTIDEELVDNILATLEIA